MDHRSLSRNRAGLDAFGRYLETVSVSSADGISLPVLEGYGTYRTKTEKCDPKTAYNDALVIKGVLKWAAYPGRGLLTTNPALGWETPEPVKPKRRMYTPDEVAQMELGVRPWLRPIVTTLAYSGLRIGELVNLLWKDVDLEQGVIHLKVREDWRPKGKRDRTIPLHPKVRAVIKGRPIGTHVFRGPKGGTLKETFALHCLKADQRRLKLPEGDLHAFRRYFATQMMQAGVAVETVRQWGRWRSLDTLLRYLAETDVKDSV